MYEQLNGIREALEKNAASWDAMTPDKRLAELRHAQQAAIALWEKERNKFDQPAAP